MLGSFAGGSATLAGTILTFAAIVGLGVVLRASGALKASDASALNTVIIYVGLPAFVFRAVHGAALGAELLGVVLISWAVFAIVLAAAWVLTLLRASDGPRRGAVLLASALGNTGYIGYPVTAALLGASAVPLAVFSDVFGTVFALVLVGFPVAARYGTAKRARGNPVRDLLTFPAVLALIAGLVLRPVAVPTVVGDGLELLANLVAPLIMLSVGLMLSPRSLVRGFADMAVVTVLRLAVAPALALVLGSMLLEGDALQVAAMQAGMPTMMLSLVIGERYGLDTDFIASAIFVTTVLSALTIPLVQSAAF